MATNRENLERQMHAAADAGKFELAARYRDELRALIEADAAAAAGDLYRQQPDAMGLGSSRQAVTPPAGWSPPKRPDPMTRGRSRPRGRS
ncbi:MAG: UvrB/UvrC motif-containing protein [Janthinobacterium lividum]